MEAGLQEIYRHQAPLLSESEFEAREAALERLSRFAPSTSTASQTLVNNRFEGHFFTRVRNNPAVIRSAKLCAFNGAVAVTSNEHIPTLAGNYANRWYNLDTYSGFITVNTRSTELMIYADSPSGIYASTILRWKTSYNLAEQQITQVWILEYPRLPHLVAIIPWCYMRARHILRPFASLLNGGAPSQVLPFLMRRTMASEALHNLAKHAMTQTPYVNPQNDAEASRYIPEIVENPFGGFEDTEFDADTKTLRVMWEAINCRRLPLSITMDFHPYTSLLGDIVIYWKRSDSEKITISVEHNYNGHYIDADDQKLYVNNVRLPRKDERFRYYTFDHRKDWDFILVQNHSTATSRKEQAWFIPQKALPDSWYTSTEETVSIPLSHVERFKVEIDHQSKTHGPRFEEIIKGCGPKFKQRGERPFRKIEGLNPIDEPTKLRAAVKVTANRTEKDSSSQNSKMEAGAETSVVEDKQNTASKQETDAENPDRTVVGGKVVFLNPRKQLHWTDTQGEFLLQSLNLICAKRRFGLILPLYNSRAIFVSKKWKPYQLKRFLDEHIPPKYVHKLKKEKFCVMLSLHDIPSCRMGYDKTGPIAVPTTERTPWEDNDHRKDRRIYIRAAEDEPDTRSHVFRKLLFIPNGQMMEIPDTTEGPTMPIQQLLKIPSKLQNWTRQQADVCRILTGLLEGKDWWVKGVMFKSADYRMTVAQALTLSMEDVYQQNKDEHEPAGKTFDPKADCGTVWDGLEKWP